MYLERAKRAYQTNIRISVVSVPPIRPKRGPWPARRFIDFGSHMDPGGSTSYSVDPLSIRTRAPGAGRKPGSIVVVSRHRKRPAVGAGLPAADRVPNCPHFILNVIRTTSYIDSDTCACFTYQKIQLSPRTGTQQASNFERPRKCPQLSLFCFRPHPIRNLLSICYLAMSDEPKNATVPKLVNRVEYLSLLFTIHSPPRPFYTPLSAIRDLCPHRPQFG